MNGPYQNEPEVKSINWFFVAQWVVATTLGWIIAWSTIGDIGVGLLIGLAQWFVLRQWFDGIAWIAMSAAGWIAGWFLFAFGLLPLPPPGLGTSLLLGAIFGGLMGTGQWFVLRRYMQSATLWIAVSAAAWSIAFSGFLGGVPFAGTVAGIGTGFMLDWLLRTELIGTE